jgi:hypothetical protein
MFDYEDMSDEEINDFINSHTWKFAKSMPKMPHWYVVRENCRNDHEFCRLVMHIRKHGYKKTFWRKTYIYLDVGNHCYWTMGNPLWDTTILNRAEL